MSSRLTAERVTSASRGPGLLYGQLIGSVIAWGLCCTSTIYRRNGDWPAALFFALLIWLCCVVGFWAGLGRARWRWLIIVPAAPLIGWISSVDTHEVFEFELFCLGIVVIVAVTTTVLRRFCGHLSRPLTPAANRDGLQFGIKQIFVWTSLAAVALSIARVLVIQFDAIGSLLDNFDTTLRICGLALGISTAVVINLWAMLGSRISSFKALTVVGMTALAMYLNYRLVEHLLFPAATLMAQLLMVVTLTILRRQGYRFVKATGAPNKLRRSFEPYITEK